jgi:hypothetical protein
VWVCVAVDMSIWSQQRALECEHGKLVPFPRAKRIRCAQPASQTTQTTVPISRARRQESGTVFCAGCHGSLLIGRGRICSVRAWERICGERQGIRAFTDGDACTACIRCLHPVNPCISCEIRRWPLGSFATAIQG